MIELLNLILLLRLDRLLGFLLSHLFLINRHVMSDSWIVLILFIFLVDLNQIGVDELASFAITW